MSIKEDSKIPFIDGVEGTKIKQYLHPHNTLNAINYSIAPVSLEILGNSKRHKIKCIPNLLYFRR